MAGFLDETFGITGGANGVVHYTTDGGKTWPRAKNSSACRYGLEIVDEQVAWHCGNLGQVPVSTDGGRTWQAVTHYGPRYPNHCRFLSFLDAQTGWAATPYQLGATTDGGMTWTEIAPPEGIQDIAAIELRTATEGYLLDNAGVLYVTQDGGESWSSRRAFELEESGGLLMTLSTPVAAMRFFDADHGVIVLSLTGGGESKVLAMRTADGGQTWEQENVPAESGALYLTRDGTTLTLYDPAAGITVLRYQEH